VSVGPGFTTLTFIPYLAIDIATDLESPSIPALEAQ